MLKLTLAENWHITMNKPCLEWIPNQPLLCWPDSCNRIQNKLKYRWVTISVVKNEKLKMTVTEGHHFKSRVFCFSSRQRICLLILGREREKHESTASCMPPPRNQTCNLGVCPNQKSNPQPFGGQGDTSTNRATQPGQSSSFFNVPLRWTIKSEIAKCIC